MEAQIRMPMRYFLEELREVLPPFYPAWQCDHKNFEFGSLVDSRGSGNITCMAYPADWPSGSFFWCLFIPKSRLSYSEQMAVGGDNYWLDIAHIRAVHIGCPDCGKGFRAAFRIVRPGRIGEPMRFLLHEKGEFCCAYVERVVRQIHSRQ